MSTIGFSYKTIWMFAKKSPMCLARYFCWVFSLKLRNWSFNVHDAKHSYRRNFSQKKMHAFRMRSFLLKLMSPRKLHKLERIEKLIFFIAAILVVCAILEPVSKTFSRKTSFKFRNVVFSPFPDQRFENDCFQRLHLLFSLFSRMRKMLIINRIRFFFNLFYNVKDIRNNNRILNYGSLYIWQTVILMTSFTCQNIWDFPKKQIPSVLYEQFKRMRGQYQIYNWINHVATKNAGAFVCPY